MAVNSLNQRSSSGFGRGAVVFGAGALAAVAVINHANSTTGAAEIVAGTELDPGVGKIPVDPQAGPLGMGGETVVAPELGPLGTGGESVFGPLPADIGLVEGTRQGVTGALAGVLSFAALAGAVWLIYKGGEMVVTGRNSFSSNRSHSLRSQSSLKSSYVKSTRKQIANLEPSLVLPA